MNKYVKLCLVGLLIIALALIRFFEHELFSDPLLEFYKSNFNLKDAPEFNTLQLIGTTSWRFLLNSILSVVIIWLVFPSKKTLLFTLAFFAIAYLILILIFWYYISDMTAENHLIIFYIRRFLIQPIFVLILLPAFYYQKKVSKEKEH